MNSYNLTVEDAVNQVDHERQIYWNLLVWDYRQVQNKEVPFIVLKQIWRSLSYCLKVLVLQLSSKNSGWIVYEIYKTDDEHFSHS